MLQWMLLGCWVGGWWCYSLKCLENILQLENSSSSSSKATISEHKCLFTCGQWNGLQRTSETVTITFSNPWVVSSDQALCQWNYIKSGIVVSGNHIKSVVDQSFYNSEHNNATSYVQHSRPALTSNIYITHLRLEISIKPPAFVFFWCVLFSNLQLC